MRGRRKSQDPSPALRFAPCLPLPAPRGEGPGGRLRKLSANTFRDGIRKGDEMAKGQNTRKEKKKPKKDKK